MDTENQAKTLPPGTDTDALLNAYYAYHQEISQYRVLTVDEEVALFQEIEAGSVSAKELFINSNLRLVESRVCLVCSPNSEHFLDLIQEGNLGLLKAVEKYRPEYGTKFSTYAVYWIDAAIRKASVGTSAPVELPASACELVYRIRYAVRHLEAELGRKPVPAEIAEHIHETESRVTAILPYVYPAISMQDKPRQNQDDDREFSSFYIDYYERDSSLTENEVIISETRREIYEIMCELFSERQRYILCSRWGVCGYQQKTAAELAQELGVSRQHIHSTEKRCLSRLSRYLISQNKSFTDFFEE